MPNDTRTKAQNNARAKLQRAVDSGKVKKPSSCPKCGRRGSIEFAHKSYKGSSIRGRFLCASCHRKSDIRSKPKPGGPRAKNVGGRGNKA